MTASGSLLAFVAAAFVLTVTPGLDTILVIRTRLTGSSRPAYLAALGIAAGCLIWGTAVALGMGALLKTVPLAYTALRWCGALYLVYAGARMLLRPRQSLALLAESRTAVSANPFALGLFTNLLNPKVGLFYLSFLPQFVPAGVAPAPFMIVLTTVHALMGLAWLSALATGLGPLQRVVLRPAPLRWLDRTAGAIFIGFGVKLALDRA